MGSAPRLLHAGSAQHDPALRSVQLDLATRRDPDRRAERWRGLRAPEWRLDGGGHRRPLFAPDRRNADRGAVHAGQQYARPQLHAQQWPVRHSGPEGDHQSLADNPRRSNGRGERQRRLEFRPQRVQRHRHNARHMVADGATFFNGSGVTIQGGLRSTERSRSPARTTSQSSAAIPATCSSPTARASCRSPRAFPKRRPTGNSTAVEAGLGRSRQAA